MKASIHELADLLRKEKCSLVLRSADGQISTYNKKGVRDLIWLSDNAPEKLFRAQVADKIIGKAAAGLIINRNVSEVYGEVMSKSAVALLENSNVKFHYNLLVNKIELREGEIRCPLEDIVAPAQNSTEVETLLRAHFAEMQKNQ